MAAIRQGQKRLFGHPDFPGIRRSRHPRAEVDRIAGNVHTVGQNRTIMDADPDGELVFARARQFSANIKFSSSANRGDRLIDLLETEERAVAGHVHDSAPCRRRSPCEADRCASAAAAAPPHRRTWQSREWIRRRRRKPAPFAARSAAQAADSMVCRRMISVMLSVSHRFSKSGALGDSLRDCLT